MGSIDNIWDLQLQGFAGKDIPIGLMKVHQATTASMDELCGTQACTDEANNKIITYIPPDEAVMWVTNIMQMKLNLGSTSSANQRCHNSKALWPIVYVDQAADVMVLIKSCLQISFKL